MRAGRDFSSFAPPPPAAHFNALAALLHPQSDDLFWEDHFSKEGGRREVEADFSKVAPNLVLRALL